MPGAREGVVAGAVGGAVAAEGPGACQIPGPLSSRLLPSCPECSCP